MLWVSEHGRIWKGRNNAVLPDGDLWLNAETFEAFLTLLDAQDEDSPDLEPFFTYARPQGEECLKVQNYVGVVSADTGVQVEILPKISKSMTPEAARDLLIRMLIELEDSPFREGTAADLQAYDMPLFEVLLRLFIDHVVDIVRKGIARTYVAHEDNLIYLRGKLQLTEHIRRNSYNSARCYCSYDEYEIDRPINRLIRAALEVVARLAREPENQQRCRELLFWFDRVEPSKNVQLDFRRMQRDRLIQHYAPAMPLCRLILERLNPLTQEGDRRAIAMLFPMERVFEDFVAAKLPSQLSSWRVHTQVSGQSLVERHIERAFFGLIPDLEFVRGPTRLIGDTKWKLLDQNDRGKNYGISQSDIYQLFAYSRKFLKGQPFQEVYLIYPATDDFTAPLRPFWYQEQKEVLYVVPFDLQAERLLLPEGSGLNVAAPALAG